MLYIVSTPIGNIKDITFRAIEILREAELILAEDTRKTGMLLNRLGITGKSFLSYDEHNHSRRFPYILQILKSGKNLALVSNAGTPGISDPGTRLVDEVLKQGFKVVPVPGPSALIAALSCSGFPANSFCFCGFVPKKEGQKRKFIESLKSKQTVVLYESCHRIRKTLEVMAELIPERQVCVCREMTKMFEEVVRGLPTEILKCLKCVKGEFVLIVYNS
ncbi:MAG: 16S rRNA (cytidine(1402)-2'-O)-methyltransferase [Candidatus Woesearchaeota archaeon]